MFEEYKSLDHDGNMFTVEQRSKLYGDCSKVIAEMSDVFLIFSRSIFFNPEMTEQYSSSRTKYVNYFTQIMQNIDIFLQEDQLMCTKTGFTQVPVPGYLLNYYELEQNDAGCINKAADTDATTAEKEV